VIEVLEMEVEVEVEGVGKVAVGFENGVKGVSCGGKRDEDDDGAGEEEDRPESLVFLLSFSSSPSSLSSLSSLLAS
jgi:hypothetical protein